MPWAHNCWKYTCTKARCRNARITLHFGWRLGSRHHENFCALTGLRRDFGLILLILNMIRLRLTWIAGLGPKSRLARTSESRGPENGVSRWRRPNSDIYSQNYHFGLVYDVIYQFLAWRQRIISLVCLANNANHLWPQVMPIFDRCLPDSHLPFVYVVILSISPIWRIGETNPSTKTSKILFSIVMPTFGKSCRRPWLHSLKNQS